MPPFSLPAQTRIGHVHLRVHGLDRALVFYAGSLGFRAIKNKNGASAALSATGEPPAQIELTERPGARWPSLPTKRACSTWSVLCATANRCRSSAPTCTSPG